jgi:hypothetical protein
MPRLDARQETIAALVRRIADLNEQSLTQLSQYISYLKWQEELWHSLLDAEEAPTDSNQALRWQFDFVEAFPAAGRAGAGFGALFGEEGLRGEGLTRGRSA